MDCLSLCGEVSVVDGAIRLLHEMQERKILDGRLEGGYGAPGHSSGDRCKLCESELWIRAKWLKLKVRPFRHQSWLS